MSLLVKALHNAKSNDAYEKESGEISSGDATLHDAGEQSSNNPDAVEAIESVEAIEKERSVTDEYIERLSLEISELEETAPVGPEFPPVETVKDAQSDAERVIENIAENAPGDAPDDKDVLLTEPADEVPGTAGAQSLEIAGDSNPGMQLAKGKIGFATNTLKAFTREREKARKQKLMVAGIVALLVLALPVFVIDFSDISFSPGSTALIATSGNQQLDDSAIEELAVYAETGIPYESSTATTRDGPVSAATGLSVSQAGESKSESKVDSVFVAEDAATAVAGNVHQGEFNGSTAEGYSPIVISKRRATPTATQHLKTAYQYFQDKNYEAAGKYYQLALDENPGSASALNGMGSIALEAGDKSLAENYFYTALKSDPNSAYAKAALLNLGRDRGSARQEELLVNAVRKNPGDAVAAHVLGQFYAAREEWSKAQGFLFSAFSIDSANADYAFNLAVSLDHLGKVAAAREYYVMALHLAAANPANFSKAAVEQRLLSIDQQSRNTIQNPS